MSKTGNFILANSSNLYVNGTTIDDLAIFTSDPTQSIVLSCGANTDYSMKMTAVGIDFNNKPINNFQFGTGLYMPNVESIQGVSVTASNGSIDLNALQNYPITMSISNIERLTIKPDGNIGIGTNAPLATLDVDGTVIAHGAVDFNSSLTVGSSTTLNNTLDVLGVADFSTDVSIYGNVGIGTSASSANRLYVAGSLRTNAGTVGPTLVVLPPIAYIDIAPGSRFAMDHTLEPGNPSSSTNKQFVNTTFLGVDGSGESATWTRARFIIRGVLLSNSETTSDLGIQKYSLADSSYSTVTSFAVSNTAGQSRGYKFIVSPWFTLTSDDAHFALLHSGATSNFRVGSVHMQFSA